MRTFTRLAAYLFFLLLYSIPNGQAAQVAMVVAERAIIYSDSAMTSPVGYISKGKKLMVGNIARNKGQVYPIKVSGKIAYLKVRDVTTEKDSMDSTRLVADRFQKKTNYEYRSNLAVSYFSFSSQINIDKENELLNKDVLAWNGISVKGEVLLKNSFDIQIITNYMATKKNSESFNVLEFGVGSAYRLIDKRKFIARIEAHALFIPFSTYSFNDDFRVKSYGYTLGSGFNMNYLFNENWGTEIFGGLYYTKLLGFKSPAPYKEISPSFIGNRIGLGINYTY